MSYEGANPNTRLEQVKAALDRRFPELSCLRCGHSTFGLRVRTDATFFALPTKETENNVADLICSSCGFWECHLVSYLVSEGEQGDG